MINAIMNMNKMIIRDVNLSFNVEKFSKEFTDMLIASLIDFFFDYDQITFAEKCWDLTTFMISFKLLKMIKFSQKIINSIVQFVRMIIEIFWKHIIASRCWFFVDDINVDDSRSNYDNKEAFFKMRLYILKHIQWLNAILMNLKKTDYTITDEKFQFCVADFKIVDFICDLNDRFSETTKMIKILKWFSCRNVSEVRVFIEVCVYYRIWIMNFVIIVVLIYRLLKNEKLFVWEKKQKIAMNILKLTLTTASALKSLNYFFLIDEIILTVNFSLKKWSAIFS